MPKPRFNVFVATKAEPRWAYLAWGFLDEAGEVIPPSQMDAKIRCFHRTAQKTLAAALGVGYYGPAVGGAINPSVMPFACMLDDSPKVR